MNQLTSIFAALTLSASLVGYATSTPLAKTSQKKVEAAARAMAYAMLASEALSDGRKNGPRWSGRPIVVSVAAERLPASAVKDLKVLKRAVDEVPRAIIRTKQGRFTCNLFRAPDGLPSPMCSGAFGEIPPSCINLEICFPYYDERECKKRGGWHEPGPPSPSNPIGGVPGIKTP